MIRVIHIVLFAALLVPGIAMGDEFNGHLWERMDESDKTLLMAGYINGFWLGTVYGADFGVKATSKLLRDLSGKTVYGVRKFKDYGMCGTTIDKNREAVLKAAFKYGKKSLNKPVRYYVEDVDSFYRQYPSCKERDFMEMLADIGLVWLKIRSYREVGEECVKRESSPDEEPGKPENQRK